VQHADSRVGKTLAEHLPLELTSTSTRVCYVAISNTTNPYLTTNAKMKMTKLSLIAAAVLAPTAVAFAPAARTNIAPALSQQTFEPARYVAMYAEVDEEAAVDAPAPEPAADVDDLTKAESLGRGAAKVSDFLLSRSTFISIARIPFCSHTILHVYLPARLID
jgi:hypothetical protein